jgi:hypothetical protein
MPFDLKGVIGDARIHQSCLVCDNLLSSLTHSNGLRRCLCFEGQTRTSFQTKRQPALSPEGWLISQPFEFANRTGRGGGLESMGAWTGSMLSSTTVCAMRELSGAVALARCPGHRQARDRDRLVGHSLALRADYAGNPAYNALFSGVLAHGGEYDAARRPEGT